MLQHSLCPCAFAVARTPIPLHPFRVFAHLHWSLPGSSVELALQSSPSYARHHTGGFTWPTGPAWRPTHEGTDLAFEGESPDGAEYMVVLMQCNE